VLHQRPSLSQSIEGHSREGRGVRACRMGSQREVMSDAGNSSFMKNSMIDLQGIN
jgi:hypothetical protein